MKINEFCDRLYENNDEGPAPSVGVSKEMRQFIEDELAKANEEALRLKEDEKLREEEQFIPYQQIGCDEDCIAMFSLGPSLTSLDRKDDIVILPNNTDQQYLFFYAWLFLAFCLFILFAVYSSYQNIQDPFTLSCVLLVFFSTSYLLLKDWNPVFKI
jgi:hypothetical protein